ncbi:5'-nucleotidase C-terminal domain-containing protein [Azospirillum thermophilum]|uniref:5'-nucleotidase C-terminal domain-containing protein n=1 Tax=Azospirillum thermophilum TaxID=2202148 RepID=UPI002481CD5F|nr:5'-nucleotidase C-terminal domain-containing protein [Azospirillum thermophilum]
MEAVESGVSGIEQLQGRFPHLSNARVVVDATRPPGRRVVDLAIGGKPVDARRTTGWRPAAIWRRAATATACWSPLPPAGGAGQRFRLDPADRDHHPHGCLRAAARRPHDGEAVSAGTGGTAP